MKKFISPYEGAESPSLSEFLNSPNPFIKDDKVIYRNFNRIYYFLNSTTNTSSSEDSSFPNIVINMQISSTNFFIGLLINEIQKGVIDYDENSTIHHDSKYNDLIHELLRSEPSFITNSTPYLIVVLANTNAILSAYTETITITPLSFYIVLILHALENHPGLYFGNNSFAFDDPINLDLAAQNIQFYCPNINI